MVQNDDFSKGSPRLLLGIASAVLLVLGFLWFMARGLLWDEPPSANTRDESQNTVRETVPNTKQPTPAPDTEPR